MLGYELHVSSARVSVEHGGASLEVRVVVENRGNAPFYYPWGVQLAVVRRRGDIRAQWEAPWDLRDILPGKRKTLHNRFGDLELPAGRYALLLRVENPLPGGASLGFANREQDMDLPGWLSLSVFDVERFEGN